MYIFYISPVLISTLLSPQIPPAGKTYFLFRGVYFSRYSPNSSFPTHPATPSGSLLPIIAVGLSPSIEVRVTGVFFVVTTI